MRPDATVAQLVEQLICNQLVGGSIPLGGSTGFSLHGSGERLLAGGVPEWPKGTGCKPVGVAYEGSNPSPSTIFLVKVLI